MPATTGRSVGSGTVVMSGLAPSGREAADSTANRRIPEFLAGDVIFCPGRRIVPHILVSWATQARDEPPTYAVHTAQFLGAHKVIEMQAVVKERTTEEFLQMRQAFEVWRCSPLTVQQRQAISRKSLEYLGRKFGWRKMFTHMLDALVNKVVRKQVFLFRRLNHDQRYPICSWITAFSYDRALHYRFGVPPECADPDQIYDWISSHPDEWVPVFRLDECPQRTRPLPSPRSRWRTLGLQD
jgi:hypothetical protein